MKWIEMTRGEAKKRTAAWNSMPEATFDEMMRKWGNDIVTHVHDEDYLNLRTEIIDEWKRVNKEQNGNSRYAVDCHFAVSLYRILCQYGMSPRVASNDRIWMYLGIEIFPDITSARWGKYKIKHSDGSIDTFNVNESRYWKTVRRIYLKSLWWYVYLSYQDCGNPDDSLKNTLKCIESNSTDEIVQLVERAGSSGYRIDLYRAIMRKYATVPAFDGSQRQDGRYPKNRADLLRKVMKLNTARSSVLEPELTENGIDGYVKELFSYFGY